MIPADPFLLALATLAHVLVLVYWLGGDLGAFYASSIVTRQAAPTAGRVTAAQILNAVDMAPRTALILAFPTGLSLAVAKGWIAVPPLLEAAVWAGALVWLWLAWAVHGAKGALLKQIDLAVRWAALIGLVALAATMMEWPLFLRLKCALLSVAIAFGLTVRAVLKPFVPAFAAVAAGNASPKQEAALSASLGQARLFVVGIWITVLSAAFLGLWTPP